MALPPCSMTLLTEAYFSSSFPTISTIPNSIPFQSPIIIVSPVTTLHSLSSSHYSDHPKHFKLSTSSSTNNDSITSIDAEPETEPEPEPDPDDDFEDSSSLSIADGDMDGEIETEIEKIGRNRRRIRSKINVEATLEVVWNILTDYERLADFIPGLAVSQLLEKGDSFARLFQIGQQNLAFGVKFNAKGILDCFEKDLESLPSGQRRDIEFNMIEGDFKLFQGKWSIEQCNTICEQSDLLLNEKFRTTLSYVVDVEPKLWLPVRLVEGRLCREINMNLSSIREAAQKAYQITLSGL